MKNGLETENWVCEARVEELEKKKWQRNVFEALLVYEKTLPSPGLGMALSSDWELYWPSLCSPSPCACGCLAPSLRSSRGILLPLQRVPLFLVISEYAGEKAGHPTLPSQDRELFGRPGSWERPGQPHQSSLCLMVACRFIYFGAFLSKISSSSKCLIQQVKVWSISSDLMQGVSCKLWIPNT